MSNSEDGNALSDRSAPAAAALPRVAVVILNWNNPEDTLACLRSVAALDYPALLTIVVDNGSTDDSVARIRAAYPHVEIIETGENMGYAGGNNVGIRYALSSSADYICLLNNDVIVAPDFLQQLLAACQSRPHVAVVTPMLLSAGAAPTILSLGVTFDPATGRATHRFKGEHPDSIHVDGACDVDIASGSAMLVRRQTFSDVGLLPEHYFLYYEDADWCLRVRQAGWDILCQPLARAWHRVSASLQPESPLITYYMTRNQLYFLMAHILATSRRLVMRGVLGQDARYIINDWLHGRRLRAIARQLGLLDFALKRSGPARWRSLHREG